MTEALPETASASQRFRDEHGDLAHYMLCTAAVPFALCMIAGALIGLAAAIPGIILTLSASAISHAFKLCRGVE